MWHAFWVLFDAPLLWVVFLGNWEIDELLLAIFQLNNELAALDLLPLLAIIQVIRYTRIFPKQA